MDTGTQPSTQAGNSSLKLRVMSAAVLAPVVLGLVWWGGLPFLILLAIVGPIMVSEWASLVAPEGDARLERWGVSLAVLVILAGLGLGDLMLGIILSLMIIVMVAAAAIWRGTPVMRPFWGAAYVGMAILAFAGIWFDLFGLAAGDRLGNGHLCLFCRSHNWRAKNGPAPVPEQNLVRADGRCCRRCSGGCSGCVVDRDKCSLAGFDEWCARSSFSSG